MTLSGGWPEDIEQDHGLPKASCRKKGWQLIWNLVLASFFTCCLSFCFFGNPGRGKLQRNSAEGLSFCPQGGDDNHSNPDNKSLSEYTTPQRCWRRTRPMTHLEMFNGTIRLWIEEAYITWWCYTCCASSNPISHPFSGIPLPCFVHI